MSNSPQSQPQPLGTEPASVDGSQTLLHRGLGIGSIVFMVVAAAAPLAVVTANLPLVISASGSTAAPLYFLMATVILVLFSVGFTAMSKYVPNAGAFYSYIQAGLGPRMGIGAAALALGSYGVMLIGINAFLGVATSNLLMAFLNVDVPWWLCSLVALVSIGFLGYRDIELSSKVLGILLAAEALVVVVLNIAVVSQGGAAGLNVEPLSVSAFSTGTPSLGLMFAFFSFIGFEATAVFRNEAKDPDRTVPRATYIAVVSIGLFYAISSWAVIEGLGVGRAVDKATTDPENLIMNLAEWYVSPILTDIIQVLLVTSIFACVLSFHNVLTRYQFTLAVKGLLPKSLAMVDQKHLTPSKSSLTFSLISLAATAIIAVLGWDPFKQIYTWFSGAATLGLIALMAMTSFAVIAFFRKKECTRSTWRAVIAPGLSLIGLTVILILVIGNFSLLVGSASTAIILGGLLSATFVAGVVGAEVMKRSRPDRYEALTRDSQ